MNLKRRGQISVEYLILVSFITFLIIGILSASIYSFSIIRDKNKFNQLESFSQKIINSAESIYYAGEPSKATINAYLPPGVKEILIQDNDIIFTISTDSGETRISYPSNVPLIGAISITGGMKKITLEAKTDNVEISE